MEVFTTPIDGLLILKPDRYEDERGYFSESFNQRVFAEATDLDLRFVQDNESLSAANVIRGFHFQIPPFEQGKLVRVAHGSILDVAVDLRKDSPTFGQHHSVELSGENRLQFWIPPGFAHGFAALEHNTLVCYKCTQYYHGQSEMSIKWDDPELGVDWGVANPIVSKKDQGAQGWNKVELPENWSI
jgi:dTDP-4-dehydrorhamnose 3,5-epimerase